MREAEAPKVSANHGESGMILFVLFFPAVQNEGLAVLSHLKMVEVSVLFE